MSVGPRALSENIEILHESIEPRITKLESIVERLEILPEMSNESDKQSSDSKLFKPKIENVVFLVHGHDEASKHEVASYLKDIEITPIILNSLANKGKTIIEKLEYYGNNASFAVVLLTLDDLGRSNTENKLQQRAKQNVILELGYFVGKYGRQNTCALYKKDVAIDNK